MVTSFGVFGSCASRDIFYSKINHNYKKFFKITGDGVRLSFISIMQPPVSYDVETLSIKNQNSMNNHHLKRIKLDLDKSFRKTLIDKSFEFLLIDTYYDVNHGIVDIGNGVYITNNIGLNKTKFFQNLPNKRVIKIHNHLQEYFKLWKDNFDEFYDFIVKNSSNTKIILNPNRHVYRTIDKDLNYQMSEKFKIECKNNKYRDLLDEYILKNFDVDVLNFDEQTLADKNHVWGEYSVHYYKKYYLDKTNQLNTIIQNEKKFDLLYNQKRRYVNRQKSLEQFNKHEDFLNLKDNFKID